jgi:hypothetical protein
VGDLTSRWDGIDKMLAIQLGEIQESFRRRSTVFEHRYKDNVLYYELEGYVPRPALCFIFRETMTFSFAKKDCGCVQKTPYGFPCACIVAMKRKGKLSIRLDDIDPHWQRLSACGEEDDYDFSIMEKWNGIQERLKKAYFKMKLHIKEAMRQLAFSGDTVLPSPPRKVVTKGASKRVRSTLKETSTGESPIRRSVLILNFRIVNCHKRRYHFQRVKVHALAITPAHKLRRLLHNHFGIYHTLHKCLRS